MRGSCLVWRKVKNTVIGIKPVPCAGCPVKVDALPGRVSRILKIQSVDAGNVRVVHIDAVSGTRHILVCTNIDSFGADDFRVNQHRYCSGNGCRTCAAFADRKCAGDIGDRQCATQRSCGNCLRIDSPFNLGIAHHMERSFRVWGVDADLLLSKCNQRRTLGNGEIQTHRGERVQLIPDVDMKVIRGICVQTAQFQIGERETCPVLGHRGQNAGVGAVTALAGQLIPILNIL